MKFSKFKYSSYFRSLEDAMDNLSDFMNNNSTWFFQSKTTKESSPLLDDSDEFVKASEFYALVAKFDVIQRELNEQKAITLALHKLLKEVVIYIRKEKS